MSDSGSETKSGGKSVRVALLLLLLLGAGAGFGVYKLDSTNTDRVNAQRQEVHGIFKSLATSEEPPTPESMAAVRTQVEEALKKGVVGPKAVAREGLLVYEAGTQAYVKLVIALSYCFEGEAEKAEAALQGASHPAAAGVKDNLVKYVEQLKKVEDPAARKTLAKLLWGGFRQGAARATKR